ncbi:MAG: DinB family protein [Actinomycetia bacterium]|nr:DinB family protein [Actinomycetes bacterium]
MHYLRQVRGAVTRGLDGVSEYDLRRPLTPSGTNLLGLVKHLASVEAGYLGGCVGRPLPIRMSWLEDGSVWDGADMWARADESSESLLALYAAVGAHSEQVLAELPMDTPATVPWWPEERRVTTLGHLLVRVVAETAQHAGHIDILREGIDGRGGEDHDSFGDAEHWAAYVRAIQQAADHFRPRAAGPALTTAGTDPSGSI